MAIKQTIGWGCFTYEQPAGVGFLSVTGILGRGTSQLTIEFHRFFSYFTKLQNPKILGNLGMSNA